MKCPHCTWSLDAEGRCLSLDCAWARIAKLEEERDVFKEMFERQGERYDKTEAERDQLKAEVAQLKFERDSRHGEAGTWERQYHGARAEVERLRSTLRNQRERLVYFEKATHEIDHVLGIKPEGVPCPPDCPSPCAHVFGNPEGGEGEADPYKAFDHVCSDCGETWRGTHACGEGEGT